MIELETFKRHAHEIEERIATLEETNRNLQAEMRENTRQITILLRQLTATETLIKAYDEKG